MGVRALSSHAVEASSFYAQCVIPIGTRCKAEDGTGAAAAGYSNAEGDGSDDSVPNLKRGGADSDGVRRRLVGQSSDGHVVCGLRVTSLPRSLPLLIAAVSIYISIAVSMWSQTRPCGAFFVAPPHDPPLGFGSPGYKGIDPAARLDAWRNTGQGCLGGTRCLCDPDLVTDLAGSADECTCKL